MTNRKSFPVANHTALNLLPEWVMLEAKRVHGAWYKEHIGALCMARGLRQYYTLEIR